MENNLNNFNFEPGKIFADSNFDYYKPLKFQKYTDLCDDIIIVEYGNSQIFLNIDWYGLNGIHKKGSFYISITSKFFDEKFYLKKTRFMKRLRKYIVEAHIFAQKIYEMTNNPNFDYKKYYLTKKQINEIKNSLPDTFLNPISRIEKEFGEYVNYDDFEI